MDGSIKSPAQGEAFQEGTAAELHYNTSNTVKHIDQLNAVKLLDNFNCCFLKSGKFAKAPTGEKWQITPRTPNQYRGQGIGIICGRVDSGVSVHGLDSDTKYLKLSTEFNSWLYCFIEAKTGKILKRVGEPPKFLIPFICTDELKKSEFTTESYYEYGVEQTRENKNQLEVLGVGNQFVAYQIHPDTNQPYQWSGDDELYNLQPDQLLLLDREDLKQIKEAFECIARNLGMVTKTKLHGNDNNQDNKQQSFDSDLSGQPASETQLQSYIDAIPNHGEGLEHDDWVSIGMGIKYELGNAGFSMFDTFSRKSSRNKPEVTRKKWDSFKGGSGKPITGATVCTIAKQYGWKRKDVADDFDDLSFTPEELEKINKMMDEMLKSQADDSIFITPDRGYVSLPDSFKQTVVGKLASRVSHCIEFPEASTALALLSGASAAVATSYAIQYVSGTPVPTGLYSVIEQPPSMMKSRLLSYSQGAYLEGMHEHNKKIFAYSKKLEKDDLPPLKSFTLTTDPTTAALDEALSGCNEGRYFIASAEQAAFQSLFPVDGSHASNNGLLLQGWAGEYVASMRKGRSAFTGYASGSVLVIAQQGSSARVFSASNGTGLAERFFYLSEPTPLGTRTHHGDYVRRNELEPFEQACRKCVDDYSNRRFADLYKCQDPKELRQLRFTDEGYQLMLETRRRIEPTLGRLAVDGQLLQVGWLGKIETHTMKVAAVLHVIECLGNGCTPSEQIPLKTVQTALEFVEMLSSHLATLLVDSGETGEAAEIDAVMDLVNKKPYKAAVLAQTLRKRHPFRAMGKEAYKRAKHRVDSMLKEGRLMRNPYGGIEPR